MKPMLAKLSTSEVIGRPGYIYEPKLDGIRALAYFDKGKINIRSRNNQDITERFSMLDFLNIKAESCILDGEIVAFDSKGKPDFNILQSASLSSTPVFFVFDIIEKNGKDLRNLSLAERKKILAKTVHKNDSVQAIFFTENGKKLWKEIRKKKLEGIIAKRKKSRYIEGSRTDDWLKIKSTMTIDCVVIGFSENKRKISSLALGLYNKNRKLVFVGKVGAGFDFKFIEYFRKKLDAAVKANPVLDSSLPKDIIHLNPEFVAEIEYLEFTHGKKLRAPVFIKIREDKPVEECVFPEGI